MILVCTGGRDHKDMDLVNRVLDHLKPKAVIVGDCPTGVDLFVRSWCKMTNTNFTVFEADWTMYGRAAGPLRNKKMIDFAKKLSTKGSVILVCFKGGAGTKNCQEYARSRDILILECK